VVFRTFSRRAPGSAAHLLNVVCSVSGSHRPPLFPLDHSRARLLTFLSLISFFFTVFRLTNAYHMFFNYDAVVTRFAGFLPPLPSIYLLRRVAITRAFVPFFPFPPFRGPKEYLISISSFFFVVCSRSCPLSRRRFHFLRRPLYVDRHSDSLAP